MWQGFNQFANAVKEQAEAATRDLGLDSQLVRPLLCMCWKFN